MSGHSVLLDSEVGQSNPVSLDKGQDQIVKERLTKRLLLIFSVYLHYTLTYLQKVTRGHKSKNVSEVL